MPSIETMRVEARRLKQRQPAWREPAGDPVNVKDRGRVPPG